MAQVGDRIEALERRVVFWGTYDTGKPRVRLLLEGARRAGLEVVECGSRVWAGIEDKSQLGRRQRVRGLLRLVAAYPGLLWRYLRLPPHRAVVVPYPGHLDVLVLRPLARLRGARIAWDAFLSVYDTLVEDRGLVHRRSPVAVILHALDWLACRAADQIFLDTHAHAEHFERRYGLPQGSVGRVFVGVEAEYFGPRQFGRTREPGDPAIVLFYGQFAPLHGLDTVVVAAQMLERTGVEVRWILVGGGQEAERIDRMIRERRLTTVERIRWIPYTELGSWILRADVCLGVLGNTPKAGRVIPNKAFQVLAAGGTLITADTPAIRELVGPGPRVKLVPPADPEALAAAIVEIVSSPSKDQEAASPDPPVVDAEVVGRQLALLLAPLLRVRARAV